jgi:hypothetical protein
MVAILPGFCSKTVCNLYNGYRVVFIKLGPKHASKDEIELAVFEVLGEFLLVVRDLGLLLAILGSKLRLAVLFLVHSVG